MTNGSIGWACGDGRIEFIAMAMILGSHKRKIRERVLRHCTFLCPSLCSLLTESLFCFVRFDDCMVSGVSVPAPDSSGPLPDWWSGGRSVARSSSLWNGSMAH